jgi:pyridoxamine 5'-phosphate oxidase
MMTHDPLAQSQAWLQRATQTGMRNANAACLSTVSPDGYPEGRIVLVKNIGADGFTFYTNSQSRKGQSLAALGRASLVFYWDDLGRQIRVLGDVSVVPEAVSDAYFSERPRDSQIGAWASLQSDALSDRSVFLDRIASFDAQFLGSDVPRPPHWIGYVIVPRKIEFWTEKPFRLHERDVYTREPGGDWQLAQVYP